ncbi:hypothetical protein BDV96DRAFT_664663 [Lophiotrema nucula]|uniref:Uncharacterized protein n=1 Tax=Lophiotrema nucula TaxID=690887 RepID=A0A6A5YYS6_9PLEO|nr:hypothetical protein BDV96DRAFT_664663 [Lophiotrema nucula]
MIRDAGRASPIVTRFGLSTSSRDKGLQPHTISSRDRIHLFLVNFGIPRSFPSWYAVLRHPAVADSVAANALRAESLSERQRVSPCPSSLHLLPFAGFSRHSEPGGISIISISADVTNVRARRIDDDEGAGSRWRASIVRKASWSNMPHLSYSYPRMPSSMSMPCREKRPHCHVSAMSSPNCIACCRRITSSACAESKCTLSVVVSRRSYATKTSR